MNVDEFMPTSERSAGMAETANDLRGPAASLAAAVCGFVWEHACEHAARGGHRDPAVGSKRWTGQMPELGEKMAK